MSPDVLQSLKAEPMARQIAIDRPFGPVWQLGYVPGDLQASLHHWIYAMGAGPFLVREHMQFKDLRYRDQPCNAVFGAALGYWGDLNIELIFQLDDAPSIYHPWTNDGGRDRLHHMGFLVDDVGQAVASARGLGAQLVQEASSLDGEGALAYVDMGTQAPHGYLEFIQFNTPWREAHAWLREAARDWDGRDPVRFTTFPRP